MGMLDFLFDKDKKQERQLQSLRKKLLNMWVQSPERNYTAEQLRDIGTPEAITILCERFKLNTQNTTYDNEEKLFIYDLLVNLGESAIEPVKAVVLEEEQQVNWPMKVLGDLLDRQEMADFLCQLLTAMTIDYTRDPEKKEQLILRASKFSDIEDIQKQVARFLTDDNEGIRFHAANQAVTHDADWAHQALQANLRFEDSGRILQVVCDRFVEKGDWTALEDLADEDARRDLQERLPNRYLLTEEGFLRLK